MKVIGETRLFLLRVRTHIERGNVNASRDTTVKSMIVVEYGGSDNGNGRPTAKSKNPSESLSTAEVNKVRCNLRDTS